MLIITIVVLLLAFIIWALFRSPKGGHDSRYSQTRNFMDFDPGADSDKVGDSRYPTAGVDSVMKHEFLDESEKDNG